MAVTDWFEMQAGHVMNIKILISNVLVQLDSIIKKLYVSV